MGSSIAIDTALEPEVDPLDEFGPLAKYGFHGVAEALTLPVPMTLGPVAEGGTAVVDRSKRQGGVKGNKDNQRKSKREKAVLARTNERKCLALRKTGATFDQIAVQLDMSSRSAARIYKRAIARVTRECDLSAKLHISAELTKLDRMHFELWQVMTSPTASAKEKVSAIETMVRLMDRKAKFLNLDYPDLSEPDVREQQAASVLMPRLEKATVEELEAMHVMFDAIDSRAAATPPVEAAGELPEWTEPDQPESSSDERPEAGGTEAGATAGEFGSEPDDRSGDGEAVG